MNNLEELVEKPIEELLDMIQREEIVNEEETVNEETVNEETSETEEIINDETSETEEIINEETVNQDISEIEKYIIENKDKVKIPIKWNGEEILMEVSQLIKSAQMGVDYDIKKTELKTELLSTRNLKRKLEENKISENDIEALIKLKTTGINEESLTDFCALTNFSIDDIRNNTYNINEEDVTKVKDEIKNKVEPSIPEVVTYFETIENKDHIIKKINEYHQSIPGFDAYIKAIDENDSVSEVKNLEAVINEGTLDLIKPIMLERIIKSDDKFKSRLNNDHIAFLELYNDSLNEYEENLRRKQKSEQIEEVKSITSTQKTTRNKQNKTNKDKVSDYLDIMSKMSDEEFELYLRNNI